MTPTKQSHTKTPWTMANNRDIQDYNNNLISKTFGRSLEQIESNAIYIIKCVNSHDALVEALNLIHKKLEVLTEPNKLETDVMIICEQALLLAESED